MPWNLLLLPLIGGYYFLSTCYRFKFLEQRLDKQRLIFESIIAGTLLLGCSFFLKWFVNGVFPEFIDWMYQFIPVKSPYIGTAIFSFVLSYVLAHFFNAAIYVDRLEQLKDAIITVDDPMEMMLLRSYQSKDLILITLDTDKVYIGYVQELPIPSVSKHIRIFPMYSGYRNEEKEVIYTNHYIDIIQDLLDDPDENHIESAPDIILTFDNVVSVSHIDPAFL